MPRLEREDLPEEFDLDHSRQLDVHTWSDFPEVNDFVNRIYDQYIHTAIGSNSGGKKWYSKKKRQLKVLLLSLYVNWLDDPQLVTGFSRTLSYYRAGSRYNKLNISRIIRDIQDELSDVGLINWFKGFKDSETGIKRNTKIWPTETLVKEFVKAGVHQLDLRLDLDVIDGKPVVGNRDLIVMHEKVMDEYDRPQQIAVEYKDTPKVEEMRWCLCDYNGLLTHHHIDLCNTDVPYVWSHDDDPDQVQENIDLTTGQVSKHEAPRGYIEYETENGERRSRDFTKPRDGKNKKIFVNQRNFVYRVFNNNSFRQGGRFYGGFWQQIPREYRKFIRIDGHPTVEIDYSSHHPVLLYAKKGINYWKEYGEDNDPYDLSEQFKELNPHTNSDHGGAVQSSMSSVYGSNTLPSVAERERTLIKTLMLILVNTRSDKSAILATRQRIREITGVNYSKQYQPLNDKRLKRYIEAIRMKHKPIANYLGRTGGMELQYLDSQITEEILSTFTRRGIPVLAVHDSYLIWEEFAWDLKWEMNKVWGKFSGLSDDELNSSFYGEWTSSDGKVLKSEKPMPVWMPKKEIHPLSKRKQYVSERHKQSLKEFQQWRKQPERIEIMKMLGLIGKFDTLPVWMKYCKELKAEKFCGDATKELIEGLVIE